MRILHTILLKNVHMSMKEKRVEWFVNLYDYKMRDDMHQQELYPRVMQRGTVDMDWIAEEMQKRTGIHRASDVKAIIGLVSDIIEDYLVEGYAVSMPLGTLTPAVTGLWSSDRLQPKARAQNKATVRFAHSKRLKETLANPLFHERDRPKARPYVVEVRNFTQGTVNEGFRAGDMLLIKGKLLLMNGDDPARGLFFQNAETEEIVARILPEEMQLNTRTQMYVKVPETLSEGKYRLMVGSQCTTGPMPLRNIAWSRDERVYCTSSASNDSPSIDGDESTTR